MRVLTWNIQWGLGLDGTVDLGRLAAEIRRLGDPDVICLQEVTSGFDDLRANDGTDQFAALAAAFPAYHAVAAPVLDVPHPRAGRRLFGNMILSRLPVGLVQRFTLPWLTLPDRPCMPRGLVVATILAPSGPLRIMTTHLEYASARMREAQIASIRTIHHEISRRVAVPPKAREGSYALQVETTAALLTGDFNATPAEDARRLVMEPFASSEAPTFRDAFEVCNPGLLHPPSMCVFDQADGPPRCLDYVFCTEDLAPRLRSVTYDQTSRASDHQPVLVELA